MNFVNSVQRIPLYLYASKKLCFSIKNSYREVLLDLLLQDHPKNDDVFSVSQPSFSSSFFDKGEKVQGVTLLDKKLL